MPEQGRGRDIAKLLGLAAVVGLGAGLAAVAYLAVEHGLDHLVWTSVPEQFGWSEPAAWWVVLVLVAGALGVFAASKLPGRGGHSPLDGFKLDIGPAHITSALLAAMSSLVAGAVLGPEAPLMAAGTAVGAALAARATPGVRQLAMTCGAAAAMGMIFGNPLITVILLLEAAVVKGSQGGRAALTALLPVMVALGFGYAVQIGFTNVPGVGSNQLAVPGLPAYPTLSAGDLLAAVPTALAAGLIAALAIEAGRRIRVKCSPRPLVGLVVAALVVAAMALMVQSSTTLSVDAVLFSGQSAIPTVLTVTSVGTLLLVGVAKSVAYSVSLGGGFRGGMIFPAVYLGVIVGMIASLVLPSAALSPMVAAGIAAGSAAVVRLPITSTMLAVLLCAGSGLAITTPAIIGACVGLLVRVAADSRMAKGDADAPAVEAAPVTG
ncbi:MAG: chloride channel protein [Candidatus Nanopelagicales bacterium]